jgi:2-oxoglutarate/2-oxoacid ferredoxin oxidoreductase subunit beta
MNTQDKFTGLKIERSPVPLSKEDFVSDQMVRWCPGCGSHAILNSVAQVFPKIGYKKENFMIVSGIGCSSRFPYYVNTYGFHGIHGRASAIATGVKIANPHLSVWIATGDGDSMAIGGNHFIHIVRRNVDVNLLLFNNKIYGLTKGQFSPTSPIGTITKTSPQGTIEHSFNPGELVIGSQGTFFARVIDTNQKMMTDVMFEAARHDGTSVVEILQNCVIYADKAHANITSKDLREDHQLHLAHGQPMVFGKDKNKGIRLNGTQFEVITFNKNGALPGDILIHDQYQKDRGIHLMLAQMNLPDFPIALGVIRSAPFSTFDDQIQDQMQLAKSKGKFHSVDELLNSGDVFVIE